MKTNNSPVSLFRNLVREFLERLTQNPEFYNVKHYTKNRGRKRNQQINF
ncbi:MAG: hypothetical protein ABI416_14880 [Ginsengibacter sp.]